MAPNERPRLRNHVERVLRPFRPPELVDADGASDVLHYLLLVLFTWNGFWTIVLLPYSTGHPPQLTAISLIEASLAIALITLRLGSFRRASWIYLAGIWVFATTVIAQNGGIRSPVLMLYVTLPVSAAWLLGFRASIWSSGACLGAALIFAALETGGVRLPRTIPGTPIGIWIQLAGAVLMCVIPLGQVLRTLNRALAKVQTQLEAQQRQDAQLRESEERFRVIADTAPVMIALIDNDAFATFFNKAWLEFRGRAMEEELGHGWKVGLHPDDQLSVLNDAALRSYVDGNRRFECRLRRRDGEFRWVLCRMVARFTPGGTFAGYIGSAIDITDVKLAQEQSFARQKLETLGTLASGIAHDFNNLLGGVMAQAELALAELAPGSPPENELTTIRDLVLRGSGIVRELMIYAGQESDHPELTELSRIVQEMLPFLKSLVSKHARLEADLANRLTAVTVNSAQLRRIIMNLVTNASDALEDRDGVIRLRTRHIRLSGDSAAAHNLAEGDYVELEVSDTGCGIPLANQRRVFDPFFTTKSAGRGLGLAVVHRIVRSLGGAIHFVSEPDRGTTFQVFFPAVMTGAAPGYGAVSHPAEPASAAVHATILVVEDEDPLRQAVSKVLRKQGFVVIEAGDGSAALSSIRAHNGHIDIMLLDITLPGASSREVLEEATRLRPETTVIVTSAYSEDVAAEKLQRRASSFIRKPYEIRILVDQLRQHLP